MSGFAALMALSKSQTKESQDSVQSALIQRQRKEELRRKQQEEQEKKEREREAKLRLKHFEDAKKQEELKLRREQEETALERERRRREEQERNTLRYGPKKAKSDGSSKWPSANTHSRDEIRRRKPPSDSDDEKSSAVALTREEKRKRKEDAELRRSLTAGKRSSHLSGRRAGGKLPGGAIDVTSTHTGSPGNGAQSIKARISAIPNTLTKLNTVKRDTRTIDEILQDRAKARETKILDGDDAREFNDWFGGSKKKELPKKQVLPSTSPVPSSGVNTPISTNSKYTVYRRVANVSSLIIIEATNGSSASTPGATGMSAKKTGPPKSSTTGTKSSFTSRLSPAPKTLTTDSKPKRVQMLSGSMVTSGSNKIAPKSMPKTSTSARSGVSRKRTRSLSLPDSDSPSPPPVKRRAPAEAPSRDAVKDQIWKMFGKDRNKYVGRDVLSDDEDMEADATALEMEEFRRLVLSLTLYLQTNRFPVPPCLFILTVEQRSHG